jgi:hypothetical protein
MKEVWGKKFWIHTGRVEVKCSICLKSIPVEEERLTANLGSGLYPRHFHVSCFLNKYEDEIKYLYIEISNPSSRGHQKK